MWALVSPAVPVPEGLKKILRSGKYSDLVIRSGDKTWNVHKAILCSQCDFLDNACRGFQVEHSGIIELHHDPPDAIEAMLEWFYSGDYSQPKVYIIGEKYAIENLETLAWVYMTMWRDGYSVNSDEEAVKFTEVIALAYADTPASDTVLREFILDLSHRRLQKLLQCNQFQELLRNGGDFSLDIVRLLTRGIKLADDTVDSDSDSDWIPDDSEDITSDL